MIRFCISTVLIVVLPLMVASETQHRFRVCVQADGNNEMLTNIITSNLKRELRALGDVDIVGYVDDWECLISVKYVEADIREVDIYGF